MPSSTTKTAFLALIFFSLLTVHQMISHLSPPNGSTVKQHERVRSSDSGDYPDDTDDNVRGSSSEDEDNVNKDDSEEEEMSAGSEDNDGDNQKQDTTAANDAEEDAEEDDQDNSKVINGVEFVEDIDETGHFVQRLKDPLPVSTLKVPTPIFLLSLPKSGTTTIHQYFQCGLGIGASAHHRYPYKKREKLRYVGATMKDNIENHRPLLSWTASDDDDGVEPDVLDQYQVFSDFDLYTGAKKSIHSMIDKLENIAEFYPDATILYLNRDAASWFRSAKKFGTLLNHWKNWELSPQVESFFEPTGRDNFPKKNDPAAEDLWVSFYNKYTDKVREFAKDHPSLTYVEIPLDDDTGAAMEERVGLPKECFGHANLGSLNKHDKGIKLANGKPKPHPRDWTVETYS
eukprot:CAMPEP_0172364056 /NCGR_PEP_ID=MMETSP1060-20121228/7271_1 /TAXON_ID=37318 /ORGANISM="Pseudo-nitzschia pungens, Strain cf. cingulata" /LENGTH=400 /DNA_ID=CAMNT_0013086971 /DNA_START=318 /DNA_END=1520 /DNA_ORIENTATION=+